MGFGCVDEQPRDGNGEERADSVGKDRGLKDWKGTGDEGEVDLSDEGGEKTEVEPTLHYDSSTPGAESVTTPRPSSDMPVLISSASRHSVPLPAMPKRAAPPRKKMPTPRGSANAVPQVVSPTTPDAETEPVPKTRVEVEAHDSGITTSHADEPPQPSDSTEAVDVFPDTHNVTSTSSDPHMSLGEEILHTEAGDSGPEAYKGHAGTDAPNDEPVDQTEVTGGEVSR